MNDPQIRTGPFAQPGKSPLRILLLSDGRPGHYTLAEGVVAAIERLHPIEITWRNVNRPGWLPARVLSTLLNAGLAAEKILSVIYRIDPGSLAPADIVVSAGGNTLAANVAASRVLAAPNIFYGSLRRYKPQDFALTLTSYESRHPQQLKTLKPSKRNPNDLAPTSTNATPAHWPLGLICGGPSGTFHYKDTDWRALTAFLANHHQRQGTSFIVTNSPRTPEVVSDKLTQLANVPGGPIEDFIDVRYAGTGTLDRLLGSVAAVLCTADSSTMLSECVWAQKPAIALTPERWSLPEDEQSYRDWLEQNGWSRQLLISDLETTDIKEILAGITALTHNPLDHLAGEIKQHLPELFQSQLPAEPPTRDQP